MWSGTSVPPASRFWVFPGIEAGIVIVLPGFPIAPGCRLVPTRDA